MSWYRVAYWEIGVTGERINVAVMVFDEDTVMAEGLRDWARFEAFTGSEPGLIRDIGAELAAWTPEQAKTRTMHYMSSLQLSDSCASILSVDELLNDMIGRMLVQPEAA